MWCLRRLKVNEREAERPDGLRPISNDAESTMALLPTLFTRIIHSVSSPAAGLRHNNDSNKTVRLFVCPSGL